MRLDTIDSENHVTKCGDNTDLTSLMTYPIPSSKTPLPHHREGTSHPLVNDLNEVPIVGPPNSKECTTTT